MKAPGRLIFNIPTVREAIEGLCIGAAISNGLNMTPDDYLVIGATESITGLCPEFEAKRYLRAVFYMLRNGE
jgi:hypothetical protein